jgi:hypothetical protein
MGMWAGGAVSAENVELIRSIQPGPEADLVALFADAGGLEGKT